MRPATRTRRSVPSASMRSSLARAQPLDRAAPGARCSSPQAAAGSSRSRNVARRTKAANSAVPIRACCAPAGVGQSVIAPAAPHRGLAHRRPRARRAGDPGGVDAGQRGRVLRRLDRQRGVGRLGLGQLGGRERVEVRVARRAPPRLVLPGQRRCAAAATRRARAARAGAASSSGAASVVERDHDLLAGLHVEAVAAQQPGERGRVDAGHGASTSGKCSATCSRSTSRIQRRSSGPTRSGSGRAAPSASSIGSAPAISQRTASRSNRNSTARCQASSRDRRRRRARRGRRVLAPRRGRHRAAQHEHVAGRRAVLGLRAPTARPRRRGGGCACPSARRRALELRRDVAAQRLRRARARPRSASARRACGSTRAPARCPG